jgi:hypothetical protein
MTGEQMPQDVLGGVPRVRPGQGAVEVVPLTVTLTEPSPGKRVPLAGTSVQGKIEGDLGDNELWLFVYAPDKHLHYLTGPLTVLDTTFGGSTGQLGSKDPAEVGLPYRVEIVVADPDASKAIAEKRPNREDDIAFPSLPAGTVVVAKVNVVRS